MVYLGNNTSFEEKQVINYNLEKLTIKLHKLQSYNSQHGFV